MHRVYNYFRTTGMKDKDQYINNIAALAIDNLSDTFFVFDPITGKAIKWNKAFNKISGYSDKEIANLKAPDSYYSKEDLKKSEKAIEKIIKTGSGKITLNLVAKDGNIIPFEYHISAIKDENEKIKYLISVGHNLTARITTDKKLQEQNLSFENIVKESPVGIHIYYLIKGQLIFSGYNKVANEMIGVDCAQFMNKTIEEAFPPLADTIIPKKYKLAASRGITWHTEQIDYVDDKISGAFEVYAFQISQDKMAVHFFNITERKKQEDSLKQQAAFVNHNPAPVFRVNYDGIILCANKIATETFGNKIENNSIFNIITSLHKNSFKKIKQTKPLQVEEFINQKYFLFTLKKDITTKSIYIYGSDMNENVHSQNLLKASEEKFRTFMETASDLMLISDKDSLITFANPSMIKVLGYSEDELIGMPTSKLITPEVNKRDFIPRLSKYVKNGHMKLETTFFTKSGKAIPGEINSSVIYDKDGNYGGSRSVFRDLSEREKAEKELKDNEKYLKILFYSAPDAYFTLDQKGIFLDGNNAAEEMIGYDRDKLIGKSIFNVGLINKQNIKIATESLIKNLQGKPTGPDEYKLKKKDGSYVFAEIRSFPVTIKEKRIILGIARDITKRKKTD